MNHSYDVVICGAGNAGIAAAYYLAINHQITNVLIIDKHPPLSQTSSKSGENIRNWWPVQPMVQLANRSFELMDELAGLSRNVFNLERRGYAYVTENAAILDAYLAHYRSADVGDVRIHEPDQLNFAYEPPARSYADNRIRGADVLLDSWLIGETFPHFSPTVEAVVHARRAGSISAQQLGTFMLDQAKMWGARTMRGALVDVEVANGQIQAVGVRTADTTERIETTRLVNAAGPFVNHVAAMVGQSLPIKNVFQQKIAFQDQLGIIPRDAPFTIFLDRQEIDWLPDERRFLMGEPEYAWMLDELPGGFHIKPEGGEESTWVKLGWAYNQLEEEPLWEPSVGEEFPELMVRGASRLVPRLAEYANNIPQPLAHYGGYYTKTEENLPLIGPMGVGDDFVAGAYVLGALSGFGSMMCCAAGELLAKWVAGASLPEYAELFSLDRYADTERIAALTAQSRAGEL